MRLRAWMRTRGVRSLREDDSGQVMVLAIGFLAISLALIAVIVAVTSVQLERKRLMTIADSAAAYAAGAFDEGLFHDSLERDPMGEPAIVLSDASIAAAVTAYLEASRDVVGLSDVRVVSATTPDGQTAVVELAGNARPALVSWLVDAIDADGVRIVAQGSARGQ